VITQFRRTKILWFASGLLGALLTVTILAPWISPYDPYDMNPINRLREPSATHLFGTDRYGRDVLSLVLYGGRQSLMIVSSVGVLVLCFGGMFGLVGGYFRYGDAIVMRLMDALMAFPSMLLALVLVFIWGTGAKNVILALTITYMPRVARVARASVLAVKEEDFVTAAKATGADTSRILLRHILPNVASPIIVQVTLVLASVFLTEAALSFLGVGIPPHIPTWGNIIASGRDVMVEAPWLIAFPGSTIVLTVLSFNLVGDALRDIMDPKLH